MVTKKIVDNVKNNWQYRFYNILSGSMPPASTH